MLLMIGIFLWIVFALCNSPSSQPSSLASCVALPPASMQASPVEWEGVINDSFFMFSPRVLFIPSPAYAALSTLVPNFVLPPPSLESSRRERIQEFPHPSPFVGGLSCPPFRRATLDQICSRQIFP